MVGNAHPTDLGLTFSGLGVADFGLAPPRLIFDGMITRLGRFDFFGNMFYSGCYLESMG